MIYCKSENEKHSPDQAIWKARFPGGSELHAVPTVPVQDGLLKILMYEESVFSSHGLQTNICSRRIFVSTKLDPLTKVLQCVSFPLTGYQWNYNYGFHSLKYHIVRMSSGAVQTPKLFRSNVFNNGVGGDWKAGRVRAQMNCSSPHASLGKWTVTKDGNGHQEKNSFMLGGTCWSQSHHMRRLLDKHTWCCGQQQGQTRLEAMSGRPGILVNHWVLEFEDHKGCGSLTGFHLQLVLSVAGFS